MKSFTNKELKCGFVILCPDRAIGLLNTTVNSIKMRYDDLFPVVCATDDSATEDDLRMMNEKCSTYKGKKTFSSLINVGMKKTKADWNFIVCAGATVRWKMDQKFSYFVESEKDVLFPISMNKTNFIEATLNGLFINKKLWNEVGEMEEEGDLKIIKTLWAMNAIEKGVKFKAIANSKFC